MHLIDADSEKLIYFRLNQSGFDWNSEDEDEDNDEPKVEKER